MHQNKSLINIQVYLEIARVHLQAKNFKESLEYFDLVTKLQPNNYDYGNYKAMALLGLFKLNECHAYLDAALKQNPNDFQLHMTKAHALRMSGKLKTVYLV